MEIDNLIFSVIMIICLIGVGLVMIQWFRMDEQKDEVCKEIGYSTYDSSNEACVGKKGYLPVFMYCSGKLLKPKCEILNSVKDGVG